MTHVSESEGEGEVMGWGKGEVTVWDEGEVRKK